MAKNLNEKIQVLFFSCLIGFIPLLSNAGISAGEIPHPQVHIIAPDPAVSQEPNRDQVLEEKIRQAQEFYRSKYKAIVDKVNQTFGIDFTELMKTYQEKTKELDSKRAMITQIPDPVERNQQMESLKKLYQDERFAKYLEAYYFYENEMQKEHAFMGEFLTRLERILDEVIEPDPLFNYVFNSPEFKKEHGLVLKRVVWPTDTLKDVSAETLPLEVHSIFADASKTPILLKVTLAAFHSLAFLRSILIHETCHIYFYKQSALEGIEKFSGGAVAPALGAFTHYFKNMNPFSPSYQYYLIHEYYGFRTQVLFDERFKDRPFFKLDPENRKYVEKMLEWTRSQLNENNKKFVEKNPDPPIVKLMQKFYG